jgi:hypothetical protein
VWCESVDRHARHGQQGGGNMQRMGANGVRRCGQPARACAQCGTDPGVHSRHAQEYFDTVHRPVVAGLRRHAVWWHMTVATWRARATSHAGAFRLRNKSV